MLLFIYPSVTLVFTAIFFVFSYFYLESDSMNYEWERGILPMKTMEKPHELIPISLDRSVLLHYFLPLSNSKFAFFVLSVLTTKGLLNLHNTIRIQYVCNVFNFFSHLMDEIQTWSSKSSRPMDSFTEFHSSHWYPHWLRDTLNIYETRIM